MIEFQFMEKTKKLGDATVLGFAIYDGEEATLPYELAEAIKLKPHATVVEIISLRSGKWERSLILKMGKTRQERENGGSELIKKCLEGTEKEFLLDLTALGQEALDLLMGMVLSIRNDDYSKRNKKTSLVKVVVLCHNPQKMKELFEHLKSIAEGVSYARSLTSAPANILFPQAFTEKLLELTAIGIEVEILNEDQLNILGFAGLLAVGKGSCNPPYVAVLTWKGSQTTAPIILAGKGVCFDSGGLCLKPIHAQYDMKWDKAGAGVVAGVMKALALSQSSSYVIGIIGLVENMPDGASSKPGDVIQMMSGETVEIVNTDAEGRLVLADCLWYAQKRFQPQVMVDLGTLTLETGACLGSAYAGLYSNDKGLSQALIKAGKKTGEGLWELPMGPTFARQIESTIADMKNVGIDLYGENGAAAEFLKCFVGDISWAHIDIGGVSWTNTEETLAPKEVTGFGVRVLEEWIRMREDNNEFK
jgi:leucyl aminopeptidase